MKELYQAVTGDTTSHQRAIDARVKKLDKRRQQILRARLDGSSLRQIGDAEGVSVGAVQSAINGALEAVRKSIAGEPRYNHGGDRRPVKTRDADSGPSATPRQRQHRNTAGDPSRRRRHPSSV